MSQEGGQTLDGAGHAVPNALGPFEDAHPVPKMRHVPEPRVGVVPVRRGLNPGKGCTAQPQEYQYHML